MQLELAMFRIRSSFARSISGAEKPAEILQLDREAGLPQVEHISADQLAKDYFTDRTDGL